MASVFFQNKEKNISNCFITCFFVLIAQKTLICYQKHCFWLWNPSLFFQILSVSAIVLANLCVSYIMTSQNEEVCIIFSLHKKESNLLQQNIIKLLPHHTLYCAFVKFCLKKYCTNSKILLKVCERLSLELS